MFADCTSHVRAEDIDLLLRIACDHGTDAGYSDAAAEVPQQIKEAGCIPHTLARDVRHSDRGQRHE